MNNLDKLKQEYNHNLTRLYNGDKYCQDHKGEVNRWLPEIQKIIYILGRLLEEIMKQQEVSDKEILEGFEL